MVRRINLFGGPCCRKTAISEGLAYNLKCLHSDLEIALVQEYIKQWAREDRKPIGFDQCAIFIAQLKKEEDLLRNGVDLIITDCPIWLNVSYATAEQHIGSEQLFGLAELFDEQYKSINIFLKRKNSEFVENGRYQNLEDAIKMDNYIKEFLEFAKQTYYVCDNNLEDVMEIINGGRLFLRKVR